MSLRPLTDVKKIVHVLACIVAAVIGGLVAAPASSQGILNELKNYDPATEQAAREKAHKAEPRHPCDPRCLEGCGEACYEFLISDGYKPKSSGVFGYHGNRVLILAKGSEEAFCLVHGRTPENEKKWNCFPLSRSGA